MLFAHLGQAAVWSAVLAYTLRLGEKDVERVFFFSIWFPTEMWL